MPPEFGGKWGTGVSNKNRVDISIYMYKYLQSRVVRGSVRRAESRRVQEARPALRAAAAYTGHGL